MSVATKIGKKLIKFADIIINYAVLITLLLLFSFGCYTMWDSNQVYNAASFTNYALYKPTSESDELSLEELRKINSEVFAWLDIYGTNIDYPVAQSTDNLKYMNTNAKGEYSLTGSIFLDHNNNKNFSDFVSIIYGHHMEKQKMFGEIASFEDKSYFDERRYGSLYYGNQEHGLKFFAFAHVDAYDYSIFRTKVTGQENKKAYLNLLLNKSMNVRKETAVSSESKIILFATCLPSSINGRAVLAAKITNEVYGDTFNTNKFAQIPVIDELLSLPIWVKI